MYFTGFAETADIVFQHYTGIILYFLWNSPYHWVRITYWDSQCICTLVCRLLCAQLCAQLCVIGNHLSDITTSQHFMYKQLILFSSQVECNTYCS